MRAAHVVNFTPRLPYWLAVRAHMRAAHVHNGTRDSLPIVRYAPVLELQSIGVAQLGVVALFDRANPVERCLSDDTPSEHQDARCQPAHFRRRSDCSAGTKNFLQILKLIFPE